MNTAPQLVDKECECCNRKVALADEAKICPRYERVFHLTCMPAEVCDICSGPLLAGKNTRPPLDGSETLRPSSNDLRILIWALVSLVFLVGLVVFAFCFSLAHLQGK
jgi:hypothetical protein